MSKDNKEFIRHILDECSYVISVSDGLSFEDFLEDGSLKRAVVRSLEIIGEATKKISTGFKVKWGAFNGKIWLECVIGLYMIIWFKL